MSSSRSQWLWRQHFTTQQTRRPGPSTTPHKDRRTQALSTTWFSDEDVVLARGSRPPCLGEPAGAAGTGISSAPWSRLPIMLPEQVIAVPKISWPSRFLRVVLREPQLAKQLVKAPTLVSLVDNIEHTVDIPVGAGGGSGYGGHHGFSPRTEFFSYCRADLRTCLCLAFRLDLEVFTVYTQDRVQQRFRSRTLTFLLVVVFKVFHPDQGSAAFFPDPHGDAFQGFFSHFSPAGKSAKVTLQVGVSSR